MDTKMGKRVEAYQLLAEGKGANEVAKELGLNYRLVCKLKKDLSMYTLDEVLASIDSDNELVEMLNALKDNTPVKLHKKIDTMSRGLTGLQALQTGMQKDLQHAMSVGRKMMDEEGLKPSEWVILVNGMTKLYESIFNKNTGTQINVNQTQNNAVIQDAVTERLNSLTAGLFDDEDTIVGEIK